MFPIPSHTQDRPVSPLAPPDPGDRIIEVWLQSLPRIVFAATTNIVVSHRMVPYPQSVCQDAKRILCFLTFLGRLEIGSQHVHLTHDQTATAAIQKARLRSTVSQLDDDRSASLQTSRREGRTPQETDSHLVLRKHLSPRKIDVPIRDRHRWSVVVGQAYPTTGPRPIRVIGRCHGTVAFA